MNDTTATDDAVKQYHTKRLAAKAEHIRQCEAELDIAMVMAFKDRFTLREIATAVGKPSESCRTIIAQHTSGLAIHEEQA